MATYTPKRLDQRQAGTSYTTHYTVPASTTTIIREIVVCNTTGGSLSFDISLVASGGAAGVSNNVAAGAVIAPYTTVVYTFAQVLATGGFVSVKASAATSLTITISGVEFA